MISLTDTVLNALRDDVTLTSLLGGQHIYKMRPAKSPPAANYITLAEVSNSEADSADDAEYMDDIEIQVDLWTRSAIEPIAIQTQTTMRALGFTHQAMPEIYNELTGIIHKPIRFFIKTEV